MEIRFSWAMSIARYNISTGTAAPHSKLACAEIGRPSSEDMPSNRRTFSTLTAMMMNVNTRDASAISLKTLNRATGGARAATGCVAQHPRMPTCRAWEIDRAEGHRRSVRVSSRKALPKIVPGDRHDNHLPVVPSANPKVCGKIDAFHGHVALSFQTKVAEASHLAPIRSQPHRPVDYQCALQ